VAGLDTDKYALETASLGIDPRPNTPSKAENRRGLWQRMVSMVTRLAKRGDDGGGKEEVKRSEGHDSRAYLIKRAYDPRTLGRPSPPRLMSKSTATGMRTALVVDNTSNCTLMQSGLCFSDYMPVDT
jgi:hypothetical protein